MRVRKGTMLFIPAAVAGALAALLVASAVGGVSPQQFVSNALGGGQASNRPHQPTNVAPATICCGREVPCVEGTVSQSPAYYCCWCWCDISSVKTGPSPQIIPCPLEGSAFYCRYCPPPPCTGVCPLSPPPTASP